MGPLNFQRWIDEHRHLLKPPVGNCQVWQDREFMITVVGGPNARTDFHINDGEEFFYQLEGDMNLRLFENGRPRDMPIRQGEIYLLPPRLPHSPQRPAGSIGLVIERRRLPHERDGLVWYCPKCHSKLYEEFFHLTNIVTQLAPVFERFYDDVTKCTCRQCGTRVVRPDAAKPA